MYKELLVYATTAVGSDSSASIINTSINTLMHSSPSSGNGKCASYCEIPKGT